MVTPLPPIADHLYIQRGLAYGSTVSAIVEALGLVSLGGFGTDTSIGPLSGPKSGQIALVPAIAGRDRADRLYKSLSVDINDE